MKKRQANKIYRAILFGAWKVWRVKTLSSSWGDNSLHASRFLKHEGA